MYIYNYDICSVFLERIDYVCVYGFPTSPIKESALIFVLFVFCCCCCRWIKWFFYSFLGFIKHIKTKFYTLKLSFHTQLFRLYVVGNCLQFSLNIYILFIFIYMYMLRLASALWFLFPFLFDFWFVCLFVSLQFVSYAHLNL